MVAAELLAGWRASAMSVRGFTLLRFLEFRSRLGAVLFFVVAFGMFYQCHLQ